MKEQINSRGVFNGGVHTAQPHDSTKLHVAGTAVFIDDMPSPSGLLHAALVLSPYAHGELRGIKVGEAHRAPGVVAIVSATDIPGRNDIAPIIPGEPLFATDLVEYAGQPIAAIAAKTMDQARAAAALVELDVAPLEPILSIEQALDHRSFLVPPMVVERGNVSRTLLDSPRRLRGKICVGGQEHFYLEGQVALVVPGDDNDWTVYSSTQHPTEVQQICAKLLDVDFNRITTIVRRLGGGFGGKESNASWVAGAAAILSRKTGRPVKLRLPREIDMVATGKRHGFLIQYEIGYDDDGRILALDASLAANGGHSVDLTPGVMMKALCHLDNCYWIPHFRAIGYSCKTNTVSNTAFRGFGAPQGAIAMEDVIERIARDLGKTPEQVRSINFYGEATGNETPYGQTIDDNRIQECVTQVMRESSWNQRCQEVIQFNSCNSTIRRGLGSFPVKFGISFPTTHMNQAGSLVHVYTDGSIRLSHGGTEMGQGLFIKIAQIVAEVFQVDLDRIAVTATSTAEVPNTLPTASSTGSDLNGWAAFNAAHTIKERMIAFLTERFGVTRDAVVFHSNHVHIGTAGSNQVLQFSEVAKQCWLARTSLSSTGFYKTPDVEWDGRTMKGKPFYYYAYGAATAEVAVDILTGESRVLRADLVQDCGHPLNPVIDVGQIEGAFVQGLGWLTCEELWWDSVGRLRTTGPSTYKIPGSRDVPPIFNVRILENAPARQATIFQSKGVGEPPLLLAIAAWTAIKDAIGSMINYRAPIELDAPATPERILFAVRRAQSM